MTAPTTVETSRAQDDRARPPAGRPWVPGPAEPVDRIFQPITTVAVVGLGYVGLPTAIELAAGGTTVLGLDVDSARVAAVRAGDVDLPAADRDRLATLLGGERMELTTDPAVLARADAVVVCVPTPLDHHLVPDLTALAAACAVAVAHARPGQMFVLTSTSYVGCTADLLVGPLTARGLTVGTDVSVAFSPERIDPGRDDHRQDITPRVVGGHTPNCVRRAADLVGRIAPRAHPVSSLAAAEMTKLLENTFRAVNIAFVNEMADVCRELDVEIMEVIRAASTKPFGYMPFFPGAGVGGHCIPCDPHYLTWQLRARRVATPLTDAAMTGIATRPGTVVRRARELLADAGRPLAGARVLLLGVAYKPGVADVRESPALELIDSLVAAGAEVAFTDALVDEIRVGATTMSSQPAPDRHRWDLVVVHTTHPGVDHDWLAGQPLVLDATYRLDAVTNRHTL